MKIQIIKSNTLVSIVSLIEFMIPYIHLHVSPYSQTLGSLMVYLKSIFSWRKLYQIFKKCFNTLENQHVEVSLDTNNHFEFHEYFFLYVVVHESQDP